MSIELMILRVPFLILMQGKLPAQPCKGGPTAVLDQNRILHVAVFAQPLATVRTIATYPKDRVVRTTEAVAAKTPSKDRISFVLFQLFVTIFLIQSMGS